MDVEKTVREYIDKTVHLSLGTSQDNKPWVCELHFAYDENLNLYFRSLKSRRHSEEITTNANVAGDIIDKYGIDDSVVGVYFEGTAKLLVAGEEQNLAAKCLRTRLRIEDDIVAEASDDKEHQFYKITVSNWYVFGRFGGSSGQKHKLEWNGGNKS